MRLKPDYSKAHGNLGVALLRQGNLGEGAPRLTAALPLNPGAPGAHYHLALAQVRRGKPQEVLPYAQKARDLALVASQAALAVKAEELLKQLR